MRRGLAGAPITSELWTKDYRGREVTPFTVVVNWTEELKRLVPTGSK